MIIKELINEMEYEILAGSEETEITTLVYDSRKVEKGSVFVCINSCFIRMPRQGYGKSVKSRL